MQLTAVGLFKKLQELSEEFPKVGHAFTFREGRITKLTLTNQENLLEGEINRSVLDSWNDTENSLHKAYEKVSKMKEEIK